MTKLTYLAVPYSHPDRAVRQYRHDAVTRFAYLLTGFGVHVYSPINHTHAMAELGNLPTDWEFWQASCRTFLGLCDRMYILMLDGWTESIGVQAEIKIAKEMGIPVMYWEWPLNIRGAS